MKKLIAVILLFCCLPGCIKSSPPSEPTARTQPTQTVAPTKTPTLILLPSLITETLSLTPTIQPIPSNTKILPTQIPFANPPARIAYSTGDGIGVIDQDDKQVLLVSGFNFYTTVAWSPDGKLIAFEGSLGDGNTGQIYTVNVETGEIRRISGGPHDKNSPAWSPDGEYLVYVEQGNSTDLVILSADGRYSQKITYTPGIEADPTWSPDGEQIAFGYREEWGSYTHDLWVVNRDGKNIHQITHTPLSPIDKLSWSPDGTQIVFASGENYCKHLYLINYDGSNLREINETQRCIRYPSWSADGRYILFIGSKENLFKNTPGWWQLFMIHPDGTGLTQLTTFDDWYPLGAVLDPLWKD